MSTRLRREVVPRRRRSPAPAVAISALLLFALASSAGCTGTVAGQDASGEGRLILLDDASPEGGGAGSEAHPGREAGAAHDGPKTKKDTGGSSSGTPPFGGTSGGSGGSTCPSGSTVSSGGVSFILIVPSSYSGSATPCMVVFSGTEGSSQMASNLITLAGYYSLGSVIFAVLDGVTYYGQGQAGATALDYVRTKYNIDNDRTYLLSESAGTSAGLSLGLQLRQSYFAAYWANDVNASASPSKTASQLGFSPWGNAGPGGQYTAANAIVSGMKSAGYRLPSDAPYSGSGSDTHGSSAQFMAALSFYAGKSRK
jgi:hypothetical protein